MDENVVRQPERKDDPPKMPGKIYSAISGVMRDVTAVAKEKINKQQGWKYRSIDDLYDVLNPALAKNGVAIIPEVLEWDKSEIGTRNGGTLYLVRLKIKYTLYAEDGSSVTAIFMTEGMDSGDKAFNKALTNGYKYMSFEVFCIPIEGVQDDTDAESLDVYIGKPQNTQAKKPAAKTQQNSEEKSDKQNVSENHITPNMIDTLKSEIQRANQDETKFLEYYKASKFEEITVAQFRQAMDMFRAYDEKKKEKNQ